MEAGASIRPVALFSLRDDRTNQPGRRDTFAALLTALPEWSKVFPPLHRLGERVLPGVSHRREEYRFCPRSPTAETSAFAHYLHMAFGNWRDDLRDREEVSLKKYLYVFRPLRARCLRGGKAPRCLQSGSTDGAISWATFRASRLWRIIFFQRRRVFQRPNVTSLPLPILVVYPRAT